jgi:hypothetical protein
MEKKTDYEALDISVITFENTDIITDSCATELPPMDN